MKTARTEPREAEPMTTNGRDGVDGSAAPWPTQENCSMCGRSSDSTSLPEPSGPFDERFVYRLTDEGKKLLAEHKRANRKPAFSEARCTPTIAKALDAKTWRGQKRQRRKEARERGVRFGTVCGRWRGKRRLPDLRLTGRWLEDAGLDLGEEYEAAVEIGKLTIPII